MGSRQTLWDVNCFPVFFYIFFSLKVHGKCVGSPSAFVSNCGPVLPNIQWLCGECRERPGSLCVTLTQELLQHLTVYKQTNEDRQKH